MKSTKSKILELKSDWAARDTIDVAFDLIGKVLVTKDPRSDRIRRGLIVETEAYLGEFDPACHTFGGKRTPRTEAMYGRPGSAYIYLIYGMYHCLNLVTGNGEAVLIRALQPLTEFSDKKPLSGPGKLCRELGIDRSLNNHYMLGKNNRLFLGRVEEPSGFEVICGPRIGIDYAGDAKHWPLRFGLKESQFLSRPIVF